LGLLSLGVVFYLLFNLSLLLFRVDNSCFRAVAKRIFVPAVISNAGTMSFYDYIDNTNYLAFQGEERDIKIFVDLISQGLAKKYCLTKISDEKLMAVLNNKFLADKDYNQVGLARINDIRKKLASGQTIDQVKKYADSFSYGEYLNQNDILQKFGREALNLAVGQASDIIIKDGGYYILFKYGERDNFSGIRFVFIEGMGFSEYLSEQFKNYWSLNLVK